MFSAQLQVSTSHLTCRATVLTAALAALVACTTPPGYRGVGGMTAQSIAPEVYQYHFEKGFTGVDDNLQFAWSRLGAAKTCGLAFDDAAMTRPLITRFGHDRFAHEDNGVGFHHRQSKENAGFCTAGRVLELKALLAAMSAGNFATRH